MQIFHFTAAQDETTDFEGVVVAAPDIETAWLLAVGVSDFAWLTTASVREVGAVSADGFDGLVLASGHGSWVQLFEPRSESVRTTGSISGQVRARMGGRRRVTCFGNAGKQAVEIVTSTDHARVPLAP